MGLGNRLTKTGRCGARSKWGATWSSSLVTGFLIFFSPAVEVRVGMLFPSLLDLYIFYFVFFYGFFDIFET